jgi:hypothetical protein
MLNPKGHQEWTIQMHRTALDWTQNEDRKEKVKQRRILKR